MLIAHCTAPSHITLKQYEISLLPPILLQDITERFTLQPLLAGLVDRALRRSYTIQERIAALLAAAGRNQVYPGGDWVDSTGMP